MSNPYQLGPLVAPLSFHSIVSTDHFGVNTLLSYTDLADPEDRLSQSLAEMNPGRLRYPGGAITETYYDQIMDHVLNGTRDPGLWSDLADDPLFLDDIIDRAAEMDAAISVVIPTVNAFELSATQALGNGTYGTRILRSADISDDVAFTTRLHRFAEAVGRSDHADLANVTPNWDGDYLREARQFVSNVMQMADEAGVRISAFEVGNEFWGSGEMTASEYGILSGQLANALAQDFETGIFAGYKAEQASPELLVQSLAAAGTYSPNGTRDVEIDGQMFQIPSQGGASAQNRAIIDAINELGAGDNIDGVVNHYYDRFGLEGVDDTGFVFKQLDRWTTGILRSEELDELTYHITEWDVGTGDPDNGGLQQAQMLIEQFYNMIVRGVDGADIWPLHFYQVQGTSLTDDSTQELAMGGEIFRMMSESLIGLSPVLDWSVAGEIDIHGYSNNDRLVLFVSERSGQDQTDIQIDLSVLGVERANFVQAVTLSNDIADTVDPDTGKFANALPVLETLSAADVFSPADTDQIQFDLEDWAILQIEFSLQDQVVASRLQFNEAVFTELETENTIGCTVESAVPEHDLISSNGSATSMCDLAVPVPVIGPDDGQRLAVRPLDLQEIIADAVSDFLI